MEQKVLQVLEGYSHCLVKLPHIYPLESGLSSFSLRGWEAKAALKALAVSGQCQQAFAGIQKRLKDVFNLAAETSWLYLNCDTGQRHGKLFSAWLITFGRGAFGTYMLSPVLLAIIREERQSIDDEAQTQEHNL